MYMTLVQLSLQNDMPEVLLLSVFPCGFRK